MAVIRLDLLAGRVDLELRFLMNALPRCVGYGRAGYAEIGVETMEIVTKPGQLQLKAHQGAAVYPSPDLSLQILADADAKGSQQFTIHTNEREFSTWEHGSSLFTEVAHYVVAKRRSHEHYPIYITDLALSTRFREVVGVQTLRPFDLLGYKKRIERQLTRAMLSDVVMRVALAN